MRKLANLLGCRPQLAPDGSENAGVCLHHIFHRQQQHRRDGTFRLLNESTWRWRARGVTAFGRLPGNSDVHPRRFRVNCGAMLRRAVAASSIGPRPRSGTPIARQEDRSLRNSRRTLRCRSMSRTRLAGNIATPGGRAIAGPQVSWKGRRHGRRQSRRWARAWSPEQIARRLLIDFPEDTSMRISHEAIYQALYVQGRGALRRELTACLRTGRALREPRERARGRGKSFVTPEILISERPACVEDRAVPGHWEGDLILGTASSAIGTLVERTTRFTILLHLPPLPGHRQQEREKNGPALAGHGAQAVREAITSTIVSLPDRLRQSLTWDQGSEMSQHAQLSIDTGLEVYFCDPRSPWQRGTNENTNGLLRQYFPKGTDLSIHRASDLEAVALALNTRPRKTLSWRTPAEALNELLCSAA